VERLNELRRLVEFRNLKLECEPPTGGIAWDILARYGTRDRGWVIEPPY
jgi:hypothetical protein